MKLKNRVLVITGGASGLGQATARYMVSEKGAKVALLDLNEAAGTATVEELGEENAIFCQTDVTSEESIDVAIAAIMDKFGAIHMNVNAAGIPLPCKILDREGKRIDQGEWENALFILTSVMSHAKADKAICDAGLKAQSVDSGLPFVHGRDDVKYIKCSDEHGVIEDPAGVLKINEKLRLVPGHCDPTCNVHDWYVGVRNGKVETVWPISARGKAY